jgi:glutaredoxin
MLLLCSLLGITVAVQAEIYTWVDAQGKKHFGDKPPMDQAVEKLDVQVNVISNENRTSSSLSKPVKNSVIMYGAAWCGVCKQAKQYFKQNNIPYKEYDIDKSSKGRRDYKKLNGNGVPIILVGNQRMDGFTPGRFQALYQGE